MVGRELIVESGVHDPVSPLMGTGVGPIARSDSDGAFETWFRTQGADGPAEAPNSISLFIEVGPGKWEPIRVSGPTCADRVDADLVLDVGAVVLDDTGTFRWST
jgi:hypothetical protein